MKTLFKTAVLSLLAFLTLSSWTEPESGSKKIKISQEQLFVEIILQENEMIFNKQEYNTLLIRFLKNRKKQLLEYVNKHQPSLLNDLYLSVATKNPFRIREQMLIGNRLVLDYMHSQKLRVTELENGKVVDEPLYPIVLPYVVVVTNPKELTSLKSLELENIVKEIIKYY